MSEPDPEGMKAARALAGWHLGHPSWADTIINAYLNPETAMERLDREKAPYLAEREQA
jgi:hypothetical protein